MNPLSEFKKSLLKDVTLFGKKFTFDPNITITSLNKVDILSDCLISVNDINIKNFDSVQSAIESGISEHTAIKNEIMDWDSDIVDQLIVKFSTILQNQKPIDFEQYPNLRVYWKIRKIFSKEEIDTFTKTDWEWAAYNIQQDELDQDKFDDRKLEKRKPWYNTELYNHINKEEQLKEADKQNSIATLKNMLKDKDPRFLDAEIELIDAEENDLPTIIEDR